MKNITIYLNTKLGYKFFNLAVRVDKTIRKLSILTMGKQYALSRYQHCVTTMSDSVFQYRCFLDSVFMGFKPEEGENSNFSSRTYRGIMQEMREYGKPLIAMAKTPIGSDCFHLVRHTDVCLKICEQYALENPRDLARIIILREQFEENIQAMDKNLEPFENDLRVLANP